MGVEKNTIKSREYNLSRNYMDNHENPMNDFKLYENPGYRDTRTRKHNVSLYIDGADKTASTTLQLQETLRIDSLSDVYLDSFVTNMAPMSAGIGGTHTHTEVFLLEVDEFNVKCASNVARYQNKTIIPNTNANAAATKYTIAHRATKFNYMGTINPCVLSSLTVKLTNNADPPVVLPKETAVWINFVIVAQ